MRHSSKSLKIDLDYSFIVLLDKKTWATPLVPFHKRNRTQITRSDSPRRFKDIIPRGQRASELLKITAGSRTGFSRGGSGSREWSSHGCFGGLEMDFSHQSTKMARSGGVLLLCYYLFFLCCFRIKEGLGDDSCSWCLRRSSWTTQDEWNILEMKDKTRAHTGPN